MDIAAESNLMVVVTKKLHKFLPSLTWYKTKFFYLCVIATSLIIMFPHKLSGQQTNIVVFSSKKIKNNNNSNCIVVLMQEIIALTF